MHVVRKLHKLFIISWWVFMCNVGLVPWLVLTIYISSKYFLMSKDGLYLLFMLSVQYYTLFTQIYTYTHLFNLQCKFYITIKCKLILFLFLMLKLVVQSPALPKVLCNVHLILIPYNFVHIKYKLYNI